MQRYPRPPKPRDFDKEMAPLRDKLYKKMEAGLLPVKIDRSPWRKYKGVFREAQSGKCGYCDSWVSPAVTYGDVEHYRPKSRITTLERARNRSGNDNVRVDKHGRRLRAVSKEQGYWKLAFAWENYLFACQRCNQEFKRTLFPLKDEKRRKVPPSTIKGEKPLLLHPYEGRGPNLDPAKHLLFRPDGTVIPRRRAGFPGAAQSPWGYTTIDVCGLNRPDLVSVRREKTGKAWQLLNELQQAQGYEVRIVLRNFLKLGDERFPYSGAVQAVFEQNCNLTWPELEELLESEESSSATGRPSPARDRFSFAA